VKFADVEDHMKKAIDAVHRDFNTIRTGRANSSLLDKITVEYYGTETPLKQLANVSTPDATTLQIQPYDRSSLNSIEKAISLSDVGLTPNNDGSVIRLNVPPLTSERRKEFVKLAAKYAEGGKVSIRNIRRDAIETVKKQEKDKEISEDQARNLQDKIQKLTDKYTAEVEKALAEKEKDIMTV
jgi:ribosome recycling factor